ncbi:MAG TPA: SAM-dependent chlorinase/fluorinase [Gemmatimonadaceae bacterium]|jgi:S-adenosylmethionine hydrolase|nr:SAM-dependent chlorinase/fluorinase [Gemmatimonadaceae bacterium]
MTHIVTLTTDFGTADGYVGEMKAELLTHAPGATLVDITHDIPRHDVDSARLTVARFWRRFPAGTVHLVVVDPGVGSSRAALAVASDDRYLVGPDNGALSPALSRSDALVVELRIPGDASATFHGRDVFAPIAAALARGEPITTLGSPPRETPIICSTPEPVRGPGGVIEGEVVAIDRFGNAITNIVAEGVAAVVVGHRTIPLHRAYADVAVGEALAVVGSGGAIEISIRNDSAARALHLSRGDKVILRAES